MPSPHHVFHPPSAVRSHRKILEKYYAHYVTSGNITSVFEYVFVISRRSTARKHITPRLPLHPSHPSNHGVPTIDYGVSCATLASPFLLKCNYDGAGAALQSAYGPLKPKTSPVAANLMQFDQSPFKSEDDLLDVTGFVYVPTACQQNATCRLHLDFHGCQQGREYLQDTYVSHVGYNDWAEANNIVVLYPQVLKSLLKNPEGCMDWWGEFCVISFLFFLE